jgi:hypothetical protein
MGNAETVAQATVPERVSKSPEVVPEPLEGQTIHEVELPAELEAIEDGADLMRALSGYRISAGKAKLVRR